MSGEIAYDYPLSKAYEDGIFGEIQYVPVENGEDNDLRIAKRAEEVLLNDRKAGYEHYLMVRTDTKASAEKLEELYKDNTSLKLSRVDSSMSNSRVKHILELLYSGELDGIVCVDMLGEGYDFPNLKIAVIHIPHKSLASRLQFIGRFARTNAKNIGKAKFIAVNNEELEIENNLLYSKDAVWQSSSHKYLAPSSRSIIAVSILVYSFCNSVIASEVGSVSGFLLGEINAFGISSNCRYRAFTVCTRGYMVSFLLTTQMWL